MSRPSLNRSRPAPFTLLAGLALGACSAILPTTKVADDWPRLKERVVYGFAATQKACDIPLAMSVLVAAAGCSYIDFRDMTCTIHIAVDKEDSEPILELERGRCRGEMSVHNAGMWRKRWTEFRDWCEAYPTRPECVAYHRQRGVPHAPH